MRANASSASSWSAWTLLMPRPVTASGWEPVYENVSSAYEGLVRVLETENAPVPLVGIGGITADNAGAVLAAGADAVAVISALCEAPDPKAATQVFLERLGPTTPRGRPDR